MASSRGDVPAESVAAAVSNLVEAREGVERIRTFLQQLDMDNRAPWAELVVDGVLSRLSSAMSALVGVGAGATAGEGQLSPASAGSRQQQPVVSSGGNTRKRSFTRRSRRASSTSVTATLEDGHVWRKYGQKEIQNSPHPRSYYRCTHRTEQGCNAKRHVQLCGTDTSKHVITYYGEHTCRDPSTIPLGVHVVRATADDGANNNLISFAPARCTNATSVGASSQLANEGSASQLSTSWCTSDDVFSSSAGSFMQVDELSVVVGSAGVMLTTKVGSAPDCGGFGDLTGTGGTDTGGGGSPLTGGTGTGTGGGGSPPSSSGFGFMVGPFGSIGDDEFFRFGP